MDKLIKTASVYVIDFKTEKLLLMYNKKQGKWLQPGGKKEVYETLEECAVREAKEEVGKVVLILKEIDKQIYDTPVGLMEDTQYYGVDVNDVLDFVKENEVAWMNKEEMIKNDVGEDIIAKLDFILEDHEKESTYKRK